MEIGIEKLQQGIASTIENFIPSTIRRMEIDAQTEHLGEIIVLLGGFVEFRPEKILSHAWDEVGFDVDDFSKKWDGGYRSKRGMM